MTRNLFAAVAAVLAFAPGIAGASVVYDTSLASPPGVFFGSGNVNQHFTVDNEAGGIQLGLQGLERFIGPYTPDAGTGTYHVATGATTVAGKTGAAWDVAFSVNTGSILLSGVTANLCLHDVGQGTNGCFNVLDPLNISDNAVSGNVAQNAEALSFTSIATLLNDYPSFNMNANDTYDWTLTASENCVGVGCTPTTLGSVSAQFIAGTGAPVPEPSSLALLCAGLIGLVAFSRFKPSSGTSLGA